MQKIFSLAVTAFIYTISVAQINSNLLLAPQPPAQLSEWGNRREVLTLMLSAQGAPVGQFKLKTEIKTIDGTVIASADLSKTVLFTGNAAGPTILFANDAMPLEHMTFSGKYKTSLQRTGKLPAGNYTLCIQPVRPADYAPMGEVQCKNFFLATTQLPVLMKPYNEEVLDGKQAQTAITFRWTPVVPRLTDPVTYRLQVFEVLPEQSPVQALRSNQPLLDKEILAATQFIWQPQLSFFPSADSNTKKLPTFIWTIQSLDKAGLPVTQTDGNGEGRSEPVIFFVNPQKRRINDKTHKDSL